MKKIFLITLLLFIFLTVIVLFGSCSPGSKTNENKKILPKMTGLRIVEKPVELSAIIKLRASQNNALEIPFIKYLSEETGVKWNFKQLYGEKDDSELLKTLFASGEIPDVIYNGVPISYNFVTSQAGAGNIIPMDSLIENYTVNIKRILKERPDIKKEITQTDGHIYSLWKLRENQNRIWLNSYFINKDWLDRLNLEMPETIEDFRNVLRAFRDNDANGNGDPSDEIPFSWIDSNWIVNWMDSFFGAFGIYDSRKNNHIGIENGKLFYTAADPRYRKALEYIHSLYEENLLDHDLFNQDTYILATKIRENRIGGTLFFWPENLAWKKYSVNFSLLKPLGGAGFSPSAYTCGNIAGFVGKEYLITNVNPYPEVSIRFADILMDGGTMSLNAAYGLKGAYWDSAGNGGWTLDSHKIPENSGIIQYLEKNTIVNQPYHIDKKLIDKFIPTGCNLDYERDKLFREVQPYLKKTEMKFYWMPLNKAPTLSEMVNKLNTYVSYMKEIFVVEGITDENWERYLNDLKELNIDSVIKYYQDSYIY